MGLAVLVLLIALVLGALLGGRVSGLSRLPVRHLPWLGGAFGLQLAGALSSGQTMHQLTLLASAAAAVRFAAGNLRLAGIPLAAAGLVLNALVIVVNGGMPVSEHAAARAGVALDRPGDTGRVTAGAGTRLNALGESIPVPLPLRREVDSPGDLLVAAGIGLLVVDGMLRDRRTAPTRVGTALRAGVRGATRTARRRAGQQSA
jgi:hypothetical protein